MEEMTVLKGRLLGRRCVPVPEQAFQVTSGSSFGGKIETWMF